MINLKILSIYLLRLYCGCFINISLIVTGILILSNIFDLLQQFKSLYIPTHYFWKLVLYKIPYFLNEISGLISFSAMLFLLKKLTKYNELLLMLCNGIHIWKIILIPAIAAIIFGILITTICNPIGTIGLQKYEQLKAKLTNKTSANFRISQSGILFLEQNNITKQIVQTKVIDIANNKLKGFTLLMLDQNNNFLKRIDAPYAILTDNNLDITAAKMYDGQSVQSYSQLNIPTTLSVNKLLDNFINPEMISIWDLPLTIKQLVEAGLPTLNYKIYYYKQLFKPIIMGIMVILASCFFNLKQQNNIQGKVLILGLFIGFITYFALEIAVKMLSYNTITPALAVLLPNICILLISNLFITPARHA
ncbi:LptF/LptG family permease [Candidatus Tisiphia endosymbiont of Nemotelus uliginosus]|uniref:LptF/LptG family permease n=1 Tax=Candidatus Tisiphia endosymbiont of Nemotelus uliginosus TaxID=3077926 RepID=UPI0035C91824